MLQNWKDIIENFNRIKDHKPRSTKKLKEIGEILASAYAKLPTKADEMWKYIINLNIADNIGYAQFYVAQVYRKLVFELGPIQATKFLTMDYQRIQLLLHHGYDGQSFYHCVYYVLGYYILEHDVSNAQIVLDELQQKYGGASDQLHNNVQRHVVSVVTDISLGVKSAVVHSNDASHLFVYAGAKREPISKFCQHCIRRYPSTPMAMALLAYDAIISVKPIENQSLVSRILDSLLLQHKHTIFADFLFLEREFIPDEISRYIQELIENSNQGLPLDITKEDNSFQMQKKKWYQDIVRNSPELLNYVFSNRHGRIDCFPADYLNGLIEQEQWEQFAMYFSMIVNGAAHWRLASCVSYLCNCMNYYVYGDGDELPDGGIKTIARVTISLSDILAPLGISCTQMEEAESETPEWKGLLSIDASDQFVQCLDELCCLLESTQEYEIVSRAVEELKAEYRNKTSIYR